MRQPESKESGAPWFVPMLQRAWIAAPAPTVIGLTMLTWAPWWGPALELSFVGLALAVAIYANRRWA